MKNNKDTPGIIAPPPVIYFIAVVIGFCLNHLLPVELIPDILQLFAGIPVILFSILILIFCIYSFKKHKTSVNPYAPTSSIIKTGPFYLSRNPIYMCLNIILIGLGIFTNNIWLIGMLIPTLIIMHFKVIIPEERYLEKKFGDEYLNYKKSVRRWL